MSKDKNNPMGIAHDFSLLRQRAEKLQRPISAEEARNMPVEEVHHLIQELQIHQVELEMQNHQLQLATQELHAAQNKYRDLYFYAPFGYVTLDEHGVIEEANAKAMDILDTPQDYLMYRRFSQFVHTESLDQYYNFFKKVLLSDQPQTVELQMLSQDGSKLHAHLEGLLLRKENDTDQVRIAFLDVTERKETHLALHNKEALLSAIINSSLNAIQVFKAVRSRTGELLDFEWVLLNRTAELFLDYTLEQLGRHQLTELLPSMKTDGHFFTFANVVENGQPATFTARFIKNGQEHWLNCVAVKLEDGFVLTFEDVTQQRIANEKLQESQLLIKKMAEAMPDFLYVEDLEQGRSVYNNRSFLAFLGYQESDIKGQPRELLNTLFHPDDKLLVENRYRNFADVKDGDFLEAQVRVKAKDDQWHSIFYRETVFKRGASGKPTQIVGVAQDITEKLRHEQELLQKNNTINAILTSIPIIIWRIDAQGVVLESVGSGLQALGYEDHKLEGQRIQDINPAIIPNITTILEGGSDIFIGEATVNGRKVYKQNYFVHDPQTGGGIGFCLDVTSQKEVEAQVRQQNLILSQLLDKLPIALGLLDLEGNYLQIEGKALKNLGLAADQLIGRSIYKVFPELKNNLKDVLVGKTKSFVSCFNNQDQPVYIQVYGFLEPQNKYGVTFGVDITELKETEEKLFFEKEFSESLLETHIHGIIALDKNLNITAWNKAMESSTSLEREKVIGQPLQSILPEKGQGKLLKSLARCLQGKQVSLETLPFLLADRFYDISLTPLYTSDKKVMGILGVVQDTTTQIQQQKEKTRQKLSQQKDVMDAVLFTQNEERKRIAEALHNSLAQLLYAAKLNIEEIQIEAIADRNLTEPLKKVSCFLQDAIKETRTLAHELIPRALEDFGLKSALKDLALRLTTNSFSVQCVVTGFDNPTDYELETHLFRFVQELLNNVMKHAQATEALVQVVDKGSAVRVRVQDNGIGMPKATTGAKKSKGMGLPTIQNHVKLLLGKMDINSTPGEGTTVTIDIPSYTN